jgi:hypothetical protein
MSKGTFMVNYLIKSMEIWLFFTFIFMSYMASSEQYTINEADNYPYENLTKRTGGIKIIYINSEKHIVCRVDVTLSNRIWSSEDKQVNKELFNHAPLTHCLSRESAEQLLVQSYLQFGRGL